MPATTVASFGAALAAGEAIRGPAMRTFSAISRENPAHSANVITGTGHEAIKVEHRRTHTEPVRRLHQERHSDLDRLMRKEHQSSQLRGHLHRSDTLTKGPSD
jgi:hypothetical protein